MAITLIGLGSNMGDRRTTLQRALEAIHDRPGTQVSLVSHFVETAPVGGAIPQGSFLNAAVIVETEIAPERLLATLLEIEGQFGRNRTTRWGERTLDLDLLLYEQEIVSTANLVLPHPRMTWRRFVLEPAVEIAPQMVHPHLNWTLQRLLRHLDETPPYVAIAGSIGVGKSSLLEKLARSPGIHAIREEPNHQRLSRFYTDPTREAWEMECDFLDKRTELLDRDRFGLSPGKIWGVSDFWFDQSDAFAEIWLNEAEYEIFHCKWLEKRERVVVPKLVVFLRMVPEALEGSVLRRNRPYEADLTADRLARIQEALLARLERPDQGPRLVLEVGGEQEILREVQAALDGMRKPFRG